MLFATWRRFVRQWSTKQIKTGKIDIVEKFVDFRYSSVVNLILHDSSIVTMNTKFRGFADKADTSSFGNHSIN